MISLDKINKIYFVGIGGIMMSALARYFLACGKEVSGSDREKSEITESLVKGGAKVSYRQAAGNISDDFDLVVYTRAMDESHPELVRARELGLGVYAVFEVLGSLAKDYLTIAIAGMHGKSSSVAMAGLVMQEAGLDPTIFVGTKVKEWQGNFRLGKGEYLLSEACEYKDSFLEYHPQIGVITNIEAEHLDYFGDLAGVMKSFKRFVSQIKPGGWLVVNGDNKNCREIYDGFGEKKLSFGLDEGVDFRAHHISYKDGVEFEIEAKNQGYNGQKFSLKVGGEFNVYNALGVIASASILGIEVGVVKKTLEKFEGVWRRFEFRGQKNGIAYYDDYAHHPTEIRATLEAALRKFGGRKWWLVYQPHLYSRTNDFMQGFAEALNLAPNLILASIYPAREENRWGVESKDVVDLINGKYQRENKAVYIGQGYEKDIASGYKGIKDYLASHVKPGEMVMTMGAGDVDKILDG